MNVRLTTPPADDVLTLQELLTHLRAEEGLEDAYVLGLQAAATSYAETFLRRRLIAAGLELTLDAFPGDPIRPPFPPLLACPTIVYTDADGVARTLTAADGDYQVDSDSEPARIVPPYGCTWPSTKAVPNAVRIPYTAGLAAVVAGTDGKLYRCLLDHVATADNKPVTGSLYTSYWRLAARQVGASLTWAEGALYRDVPAQAKSLIRLLVGHWFANREPVVVGMGAATVPMTVDLLLWSLRTF